MESILNGVHLKIILLVKKVLNQQGKYLLLSKYSLNSSNILIQPGIKAKPLLYTQRRTGNFFAEGGGRGAVNHLPKKFSQVADIFTKQSKRKDSHTMQNIGCTGMLRWLNTVFQGQYLPSLSINYITINKHLEKLPPQLYQIKMKICHDRSYAPINVNPIGGECRQGAGI